MVAKVRGYMAEWEQGLERKGASRDHGREMCSAATMLSGVHLFGHSCYSILIIFHLILGNENGNNDVLRKAGRIICK